MMNRSSKNIFEPATPNLFRVSKSNYTSSKSSLNKLTQQISARTRLSSVQSNAEIPKESQYLWNCCVDIEDPRYPNQPGKMITIDRKSWIEKIEEGTSNIYRFIYGLDGIGYPKNPMGRTGRNLLSFF